MYKPIIISYLNTVWHFILTHMYWDQCLTFTESLRFCVNLMQRICCTCIAVRDDRCNFVLNYCKQFLTGTFAKCLKSKRFHHNPTALPSTKRIMKFNHLCLRGTKSRWRFTACLLPLIREGKKFAVLLWFHFNYLSIRPTVKHENAFHRSLKNSVSMWGNGLKSQRWHQFHWSSFHPYSLQFTQWPSMRTQLLPSAAVQCGGEMKLCVRHTETDTAEWDNISIMCVPTQAGQTAKHHKNNHDKITRDICVFVGLLFLYKMWGEHEEAEVISIKMEQNGWLLRWKYRLRSLLTSDTHFNLVTNHRLHHWLQYQYLENVFYFKESCTHCT